MPPTPDSPSNSATPRPSLSTSPLNESSLLDHTVLTDPLLQKSSDLPPPPPPFTLRKVTPLFSILILIALAMGLSLTQVPGYMTTAFARIQTGDAHLRCSLDEGGEEDSCGDHDDESSDPCKAASDTALDAAAYSDMVKNLLTFFFSAYLGSVSDRHGRKKLLLFALLLNGVQYPVFASLVNLVESETADIGLIKSLVYAYYACNSASGALSFLTIMLSCLADVTPSGPGRAVAFGLLLAIACAGVFCTPLISVLVFQSDALVQAKVSAFLWTVAVPVSTFFFFKETVTPEALFQAR